MHIPQMRRMRDETWRIVVGRAERTRPTSSYKKQLAFQGLKFLGGVKVRLGCVKRDGKEGKQT